MRPLASRLPSVRRSLPVFLSIVVCLALGLVWLTWRLMEQDRNLAAQRERDRLEQVADLAMAQLAGTLSAWDLSLRELETLPPPATLKSGFPATGTLIQLKTPSEAATFPARPLLFVPNPPAPGKIPANVFDAEEKLEFRDEDYAGAIAALQPLTERVETRAEALLRTGRLERRLNRPEAALAAYDRISRETAISPDGVPYAFTAALARCEMTERACAQLRSGLLNSRWPVRRETFEYYWGEASRLARAPEEPPQVAIEFATRISSLYEQWRQSGPTSSGRTIETDGSLLVWQSTPSRLTALALPEGWLSAAIKLPANATDIRWRPGSAGAGLAIRRSLAEAQLDGRLEFYSVAPAAAAGFNRALWLTVVALMLTLVLAGAYAMHRGIGRELAVAQLQSDFVAAVSHEFRSPLTSLRGIAELLASGRLEDEARRQRSYDFLERETGRLQRLVEDLLDFGRMESGRKEFHIESHHVFALVRRAVSEFREEALRSGFEVDVRLDGVAATIKADEEALGRAIRNLLENAIKYSPDCRTVRVEGRLNHSEVAISVRDRGMGIEPRERRDIFRKFVRGAAAKKAGIKGTGIGLTMVRESVEACGGEIRVESEVGAGSTFTIVLPVTGVNEATA